VIVVDFIEEIHTMTGCMKRWYWESWFHSIILWFLVFWYYVLCL